MRRSREVSNPLAATLGCRHAEPASGVSTVEVFAYYDGPLAGLMAGPGGDRWLFECVAWDEGPERVWVFWPLLQGASPADALEVYDALAAGCLPASAPTFALTVDPEGVTRAAAGSLAALQSCMTSDAVWGFVTEVAERLRSGGDLPDGVVDLDADVYVGSLRHVGADGPVVEAARVHLARDPSSFVHAP